MQSKKRDEAHKLAEVSRELSAAAMGIEKADVIITGGNVVNVHTGEIEQGKDVVIKAGRVVLVGKSDHARGENTEIIDASGYYLAPGFMDGHVHIESSMVTATEFAKAVLPNGTTTVFMDPHEIANVLGMDGVKLMIEEGKDLPLRVYATMPSCVPAAPGFEDAGAVFGPKEVEEAMEWDEIIGLGEMMNFPGVIYSDENVHGELGATIKSGKVITGHYSIPDLEIGLQAYVAAGIASCHEATTKEEALARMRLGMYVKMREGSAWHDVKETVKAVTENNIDTRYAILVSDDTHPHTLLDTGHLDHVVRRAIQEGVNPITAIQMVTINTAQCFEVDRFMGSIAPGRYADILFIKDLAAVDVEKVMVNGKVVAQDKKLQVELERYEYPGSATQSVHLKEKLEQKHFEIKAPIDNGLAEVNVMEIIEAHVGTKHRNMELPVKDGLLQLPKDEDVLKIMVMERHGVNGTYGLGLVKGFGLKEGAVASTVAHDSHNLLIMGTNDEDMAYAGNVLAEHGGGMVAVKDGKVLALLPLEIAGLMSQKPVEEVRDLVDGVDKAWKELGCQLVSPFMTMALISLPVLPELRLTNKGLVDTINFKIIDLFK
ncbi:adenine deaminase [Desulfitispora alkaliphila]|uniref:adenine deaminase n=1 Tax=Desulfitispora alkaliphila TaxID=622674 RepID=UPI003D1E0EBA